MAAPKNTVTYKKPNTGELQGDLKVALGKLQRQFLQRLRVQIQQTAFSKKAKVALSRAMTVEVKKSALVITVHHPAWRPMVEGHRRKKMVWLKDARAPIPIVTETGEVIFRRATARSLRKGGTWIYPGRKPSDFVERARREVRAWAKKKLPPLLAREIARTLGGR